MLKTETIMTRTTTVMTGVAIPARASQVGTATPTMTVLRVASVAATDSVKRQVSAPTIQTAPLVLSVMIAQAASQKIAMTLVNPTPPVQRVVSAMSRADSV